MKWSEFAELVEIYDAQEICLIAEVDKNDDIVSKVIMGDTRGDGLSDMMFKEMFNCKEEIIESKNQIFTTKSGRIFKYLS